MILNHEEEILELLKMQNKRFERIDQRFDEQEAMFHQKFVEQQTFFQQKFGEQDQKFAQQETKLASQDARLTRIEDRLEKHDQEIAEIKRIVLNIEVQVTEKIPALFDAFAANQDKHEIYDKNISSLNAKTFNHDLRISALEDKLRTISI